ncbi:hypothetical protein K502DRAFT_282735, partial [Neoconidiobolus thromboides FSU 785]
NSKKLVEQVKEALDVDPTAYEYDEVYDQMKDNEKKYLDLMKGTDDNKPKYIQGLLKTAELRKRDRLRAEGRLVEKEKERESELYKGKEEFVTTAYKQQQEELKRLEKEDNIEDDQSKDGNMFQFYENLLSAKSRQIEAGIITKEIKKEANSTTTNQSTKEDLLAKALKEGKKIEINANNEVIDKRQLLSAGLNIVRKDVKRDDSISYYDEFIMRKKKAEEEKRLLAKKAQANRMKKLLTTQLEESKMLEVKKGDEKFDKLKDTLKRKNDDGAVLDAKARYLLRKK